VFLYMFSHILYNNVRHSHWGHTGHEYKRGDLSFALYLFNRNGGIYYINNVFESPSTTTAAVVRIISRFGIAAITTSIHYPSAQTQRSSRFFPTRPFSKIIPKRQRRGIEFLTVCWFHVGINVCIYIYMYARQK